MWGTDGQTNVLNKIRENGSETEKKHKSPNKFISLFPSHVFLFDLLNLLFCWFDLPLQWSPFFFLFRVQCWVTIYLPHWWWFLFEGGKKRVAMWYWINKQILSQLSLKLFLDKDKLVIIGDSFLCEFNSIVCY